MPRATIIGAGIAGTATAIGLIRNGWHVTLHERAPHRETSGAALGIWPTALAVLDELGVGEALRAVATPQGAGTIRRPDGAVLAALSAERVTRRPGDRVHLVARRDLADLLAAALPVGAVRYGSRIEPGEVPGDADVLVVADGVFSAHRTALLGQRYRARYTGQSTLRGRAVVASREMTETWGPGRRFGVTPYLDGTSNWYASLDAPRGDSAPGGEVAMLRELFAGWHDPIGQVLDVLTEGDVMRHDLYDVHPHLPTYVVAGERRAVLVGDAAHGMTPDLGRGACEALVDAATLARCLASVGSRASGTEGPGGGGRAAGADVDAALVRYDRLRRRPTQRLQTLAHGLGRIAHARRLAGVRDFLMSAGRMVDSVGARTRLRPVPGPRPRP